jgi:hypothetical protein
MMSSRGMGAVKPSKLPKKGKRKDGCSFDMYAEGGEVWDKPIPLKKSKALTAKEKTRAKARAKAAGREYPNLVDNIRAKK